MNHPNNSHPASGFTLVELIVVIVILGILAATALPKFINISQDARKAAVQGLVGAINAASTLAQAKYQAVGDLSATTVGMGPTGGTSVGVAAGTGIPTVAGIQLAVDTSSITITPTGNVVNFIPSGGTTTNAAATSATVVTAPSTGCAAWYNSFTGVATAMLVGC